MLGVPLLREGNPVGVIALTRSSVRPFGDKQIELVTTFADQAVIAIENARLFEAEQASKRELARSVEELESLGKVSQAVNSSLELDKVLPTILEHACTMSYAGGGTVYVFDKTTSELRLAAAHNMSDEHIAMVRAQPIRLNSVVVGECATRREVVQIADLSSAAPSPLLDILLRTGVRAVLAVPLLHQAEVVGVLVVRRNQAGTFSPEVIRLVEAFAAQSAIAVENARLFGEIAKKSRELEIASQHKSQFVANMSHELRTPLAAILGYAELMQEGFYGNQSDKSMDALTRIRSNGRHLLGLINTVLDIAKIESGQFTLNMAEYAIESVVETVRSATESLAQNKKLALKTEVAKSLPIGLGDEQRLTQVLLNLVGNAIKFTDAGEVRVTAKAVNGRFNVRVTDTGPGIPEEHQARIFEQFHQVDSSNTKAKGGTGLGLAIAKQIVEMHGGRIWVQSTLGQGATFQMELPTRAELRNPAS
jgi:signal transduction histidine kinase